MDRYNPSEIEPKWQQRWQETKLYEVDLHQAKNPYYNLMMFPYPSAEGLHVGNVYAFTGSDIHGRFQAMRGKDVFEPMGFDAFGIHSENYAMKVGQHPARLTANSIERFRETQLKKIGNRFDWSHEVDTTDPDYYRWTQWIFTQLFKRGLAVRKKAAVNWCPVDKTVLADEQVIDGRCERCGNEVEQRELEQWFFKITDYSQRLLDDLDWIDWSDKVRNTQRNWIGRSEGAQVKFPIEGHPDTYIEFFTTRPDTIYGVTFMVLAPEHPLVEQITTPEQRAAVEAYIQQARRETPEERQSEERQKTGVPTGAYAINVMNGERVPIWIADYVLMGYGTGAIMAVPAHDERDFAFARKFGLPIRLVYKPEDRDLREEDMTEALIHEGVVVNSGPFNGLPDSAETVHKFIQYIEEKGYGQGKVTYRLRDWLISRQRYWGPPIPVIYCPEHGAVPVPDKDLPVQLPMLEDYVPKGTGSSPLADIPEFVNTTCPICGKPSKRETDVSDNFLDSAWYFLRYPSTHDDQAAFDPTLTRKWLPVDMYIGGAEHSVLHLLYTRFICMALHDMGYLDFDEPFKKFRAHGMIIKDGAKMSKSKGNVVNPDEYIARYGADALRVYLMFLGPYDQGGDFSDQGINGVVRFLNRVWDLVLKGTPADGTPPDAAERARHRLIKKVIEDTGSLKYNTAIAAMMEYLNDVSKRDTLYRIEAETLLLLLAPYAPFITEELWQRIGNEYSIHTHLMPEYSEEMTKVDVLEIPVQVNGKLRDVVSVPATASKDELREQALASEKVQKYLNGGSPRQVIVVPGRMVNVVV